MDLFRTQRGGKEIGNYKYYDSVAKKNVDTGTSDLELARLKLPTATLASPEQRPSLASVSVDSQPGTTGPSPSGTPTINAAVSVNAGNATPGNTEANQPDIKPPVKDQVGLRKPESPQYTPAQITRLRDNYANMIAEADCDMLRLMFSMFGYTTPDIRPEDVAQIRLGWEMLAMEWFINGVPPAWLVLTLTHIKLISRLAINAKEKPRKNDESTIS